MEQTAPIATTEVQVIKFPIAETFVAPQGEGVFVGTMMLFVRLAGCSVGKPFENEDRNDPHFHIFHSYQTKCTAWDGTEFACDTNYRKTYEMSPIDIINMALHHGVRRVCLTGGEPLMHARSPELVGTLIANGISVHIETSGTIPLKPYSFLGNGSSQLWITVSPKKGYLEQEISHYANEIKILVDQNTNEQEIVDNFVSKMPWKTIYIQPINDETSLRMDNVKRCLQLMQKYPTLRLSVQLHKVVGTR